MYDFRILRDNGGEVVILCTSANGDEAEKVLEGCFTSVSLAVFSAHDWDACYSPWEMRTEGRYFAGRGRDTLCALEQLAREKFAGRDIYLAGYSLAGLFCLWAMYESAAFEGCACCSGSLWFEGWREYAQAHRVNNGVMIYLSLGGKEAHTRDPLLSGVETAMKLQNAQLDMDSHTRLHMLEMNKGGHFSNPAGRLAKGINWLIRYSKLNDGVI